MISFTADITSSWKVSCITLNKTELCICSPNLWSRNSYLLFLLSVFSIDTVRKGKKHSFHTSASISLHFIQKIQIMMLTKLSYLLPVTKQLSYSDGNKCPNSLCKEILLKFTLQQGYIIHISTGNVYK